MIPLVWLDNKYVDEDEYLDDRLEYSKPEYFEGREGRGEDEEEE